MSSAEYELVRSPVYLQLNDRLRESITRDYSPGSQFLTEREISRKFQVSRATANKALAGLVSERLLEFRKGRGTFVLSHAIPYDVQTLVSFTEKARAAGLKPRTQSLVFRSVQASDAPALVRDALKCASDDKLIEMQRLRLADGTPVILEHRWVVQKFCPRLTEAQAKGSLYQAFTRQHGLRIGGADEVIQAVALKASAARHLEAAPRSPAFEVIAVGFLDDGQPLWWERTLYRGDSYEFHSRLGPLATGTPPRGKLRPQT